MRLTAHGANRRQITHELATQGDAKSCTPLNDGGVVISWTQDNPMGLGGQYDFELRLTKSDIATIGLQAFSQSTLAEIIEVLVAE